MYSTTAGQADDKKSFCPAFFPRAFFILFAISREIKSAPIAVSETAWKPSFLKAATSCPGFMPQNSETNDGARETITLPPFFISVFTFSTSGRVRLAVLGQHFMQFPQRTHSFCIMSAWLFLKRMAFIGHLLMHL
jgi:hypothetical protein